jgi:hypothetical protein
MDASMSFRRRINHGRNHYLPPTDPRELSPPYPRLLTAIFWLLAAALVIAIKLHFAGVF